MILAGVIVFAIVLATLIFLKDERKNNFEAAARRIKELNKQGIAGVFLVQLRLPRTDQNMFWQITLWSTPSNTGNGELMYVRDDELIYEAPWWNNMAPIEKYNLSEIALELGEGRQLVNIYDRIRRGKMPGIVINRTLFFVLGRDITNPDVIRKATHYQSWVYQELDANRRKMLEVLAKVKSS
jgi:hypothetical protein